MIVLLFFGWFGYNLLPLLLFFSFLPLVCRQSFDSSDQPELDALISLSNIVTGIGKGQVLQDENCNSNAKAVTFVLFIYASVYNAHTINVFEIDTDVCKQWVE